jgi:hypothetical protein
MSKDDVNKAWDEYGKFTGLSEEQFKNNMVELNYIKMNLHQKKELKK